VKHRAIPLLLWGAFAATTAMVIAGLVPQLSNQHLLPAALRRAGGAAALARSDVSLIVAYTLALWFSLAIGNDHKKGSAMRWSWRLISVSCGIALVRFIFELMVTLFDRASVASPWIGLRQIPNASGSLVLLAGLVVMWSGFSAFRMGAGLRWIHKAAIAVIIILIPAVIVLRENLPDGHSIYPVIRVLQTADALLILASAVVGVLLHRIGEQIEAGELATALRYLVLFLILRPLLFVVRVAVADAVPPVVILFLVGFSGALQWLFVIAIFYRWRVTLHLSELAKRYSNSFSA
jgi:hypothetical protein